MQGKMTSYKEEARENRERIKKLYAPPPLHKIRYLIINKRSGTRYYIKDFKVFVKRKEQIKKKFPDYKTRFIFIKQ